MGHWEEAGKSNEWYTPKHIFDALGCEFDTDVASPIDRKYCHVPAHRFVTQGSLDLDWSGFGFTWMNPPFEGRNGLIPWLNKMIEHGDGIALTPDRSSAPSWQLAAKHADAVLFFTDKPKFIRPDGTIGKQPGCGACLFAYGDYAVACLEVAENDLGIVMRR